MEGTAQNPDDQVHEALTASHPQLYCFGSPPRQERASQAAGTASKVQMLSFESGSSGSFEALGLAAGSWGAGFNYDDEDCPENIAVEELISQLVASKDPNTSRDMLLQLSSPSIPQYSIINSEAWLPLVQQLPKYFTSSCPDVIAAAEQLLMRQLAPELLDCSPEPLAQLLHGLLAASCCCCCCWPSSCSEHQQQQQLVASGCGAFTSCAAPAAAAAAACQQGGTSNHHHSNSSSSSTSPWLPTSTAAAAATGTGTGTGTAGSTAVADSAADDAIKLLLPDSVVQLLVVGLHKLARQWHFLAPELAQQLCGAIVDLLLQPMLLPRQHAGISSIWQQQQQQQQPDHCGKQRLPEQFVRRKDWQRLGLPDDQQQLEAQQMLEQQAHHFHHHHQQEQQQQQQEQKVVGHASLEVMTACCLAEQLLLADPNMGWWHRLNASSSSGRTLREAAASKGLCQQLLYNIHCMHNKYTRYTGALQESSSSSSSDRRTVIAEAGTAADTDAEQHPLLLDIPTCLITQLLCAFVASQSGRRLLASEFDRILCCSDKSAEPQDEAAQSSSAAAAAAAPDTLGQQVPAEQYHAILTATVDYLAGLEREAGSVDKGLAAANSVTAAACAAAHQTLSMLQQQDDEAAAAVLAHVEMQRCLAAGTIAVQHTV